MQTYKRETKGIVTRLLLHQLSFPQCISGLDASLGRLTPSLKPDNMDELRAIMLANNERVMAEMARRGSEEQIPPSMEYRNSD